MDPCADFIRRGDLGVLLMFPDLSNFDPPFPPPFRFGVLLPLVLNDLASSVLDDLSLFTPALAPLPDLVLVADEELEDKKDEAPNEER